MLTNARTENTQTFRLENWSVRTSGDYFNEHTNKYQPYGYKLIGNVFGNPRHVDKTYIETSPIQSVDGRTVTTYSGSKYVLGEPSWSCRENMELEEGVIIPIEEYLQKFVPTN